MELELTQPNWKVKPVPSSKARNLIDVWPPLANFCNMDKWFPNLHTCYQVDGVSGQPGLVRYCKAGRDKTTIKWGKEKLLVIIAIKRRRSYEIVDNNMGFKSYVATMQV